MVDSGNFVLDASNARIKTLEELYSRLMQTSDARSFFTYLYDYVMFIRRDFILDRLAWALLLKSYAEENSDVEWPKTKMGLVKWIPDNGAINDKWTEAVRLTVDESLKYVRAVAKVYDCWFKLFIFGFTTDVTPEMRNRIDSSGPPAGKVKNGFFTMFTVEERRIYQREFVERNSVINPEDYRLYAEVFHRAFISWIQLPITPLHEAMFEFEYGVVPIVSCEGRIYRFARLRENGKPYSILNYCKDKTDRRITDDDLRRDLKLRVTGKIADTFKDSPFKRGGSLNPFVKPLTPSSLTFRNRAFLSDEQLKLLSDTARNVSG